MRLTSIWVCLLGFTVASGQTAPAEKSPLRIEDLNRLESFTAVLLPRGERAVAVRQWIDPETKRERSSLWIVDGETDRRRPLEEGEPDGRAPIVSPDGKWIAFLSSRPRPPRWKQTAPVPLASDPAVDIWLIPAVGGSAIPLAAPEKNHGRVFNDGFYGRVTFSPDGKRVAFVADDGSEPRTAEERQNDVSIVRADQGEGYTGYGAAQVWVAYLDEKPERFAARRIDRLTKDDVWYGDPQWSPDGRTLVVHANTSDDRESVRYSINKNYDLIAIDVETHKQRRLTSGPGPEVSPRFSPDGKRIACLSIPRKGSHRDVFNLAVVDISGDQPKTTILFDHHGRDAERPPHPAPAFPLPQDCWDGSDHLVVNAEVGTRSAFFRVGLRDGKGARLEIPTDRETKADPATFVGRRLRERRLSPASNAFLADRILGESKVITWDNGEGMTIEGVLTLPPKGVATPPYKLILYPHGGPHSRAVLAFNFTVEAFAAHGYAVFQPNFRGSSGYGQKFIDADRKDLGGGDMRDILSGIDHLVKDRIVARNQQYVYGISYGGFMTCWLVGQTNQFRAAVAQNAVTDLNAMWGLSDLQSWTEWEFAGKPWQVPDAMRKHSPITHVDKVKTPTLILHSRDDRRCPLPMGRMYHQALAARKVATQMVVYPDEGHGIRQPRHRVDVLKRTLAWFELHR